MHLQIADAFLFFIVCLYRKSNGLDRLINPLGSIRQRTLVCWQFH